MVSWLALLVSALPLLPVWGTPVVHEPVCAGGVVTSETYIGKDKNVKVEYVSCAEPPSPSVEARAHSIEARQSNVCGATCNTNCFLPAGGGPDPNECHVIADALRFESQNTGALFQIGTGTNNTIVMTYSSCRSFFVNQDFNTLIYCRTDWAAVLDFVAFNCQAPQNAHGGNCVASDQRWFIQAQHS